MATENNNATFSCRHSIIYMKGQYYNRLWPGKGGMKVYIFLDNGNGVLGPGVLLPAQPPFSKKDKQQCYGKDNINKRAIRNCKITHMNPLPFRIVFTHSLFWNVDFDGFNCGFFAILIFSYKFDNSLSIVFPVNPKVVDCVCVFWIKFLELF